MVRSCLNFRVIIPRWYGFCFVWVIFGTSSFWNSVGAEPEQPLGNELASIEGAAFGEAGGSYRHDFCARYQQMIDPNLGEYSVKNALSGTELTISLEPNDYFHYDNENGIDPSFPGVHALILDYIAKHGNFTWRNSFGVWTREEKGNQAITTLLDWGTDKYDIMVGLYTPSTERMNRGISFTSGHFDGSLVMARNVIPKESKVKIFNWIRPFEPRVWCALIAVVIFSAFVYQFLEHLGAEHEQSAASFRKWTMENLYLGFINFTGNYSYQPTTLSGKVFGFSFAFWAMLVTAAYTANLASLLVTKDKPDLPMRSILDAVDRRFAVCVHATSFSENYLKQEYPELDPNYVLVNKTVLYDALYGKECEVMVAYQQELEIRQLQKQYNPTCTLERQGRVIKTLRDGFATKLDPGIKCSALVNAVVNYYMKEMEDNGYLAEVWSKHSKFFGDENHCQIGGQTNYLQDGRRKLKGTAKGAAAGGAAAGTVGANDSYNDEDGESLTLNDMAGTLVFQLIGSAIALVIAFVSGFDSKTKTKRETRKNSTRNLQFVNTESTVEDDEMSTDDTLRRQLGTLSRQIQFLNNTVEKIKGSLHAQNEIGDSCRLLRRTRSITTGKLNKEGVICAETNWQ